MLLSDLETQHGHAFKNEASDGMQNCTCVDSTQMSTDDNTSIPGSQNNNDNSAQMMRNPTDARKCVAMNLGTMGNNMNN